MLQGLEVGGEWLFTFHGCELYYWVSGSEGRPGSILLASADLAQQFRISGSDSGSYGKDVHTFSDRNRYV